jgi:hypothetical protein
VATTELDFCSGFDLYNTLAAMQREWTVNATSIVFKTGRFGSGNAVRGNFGLGGNVWTSKTVSASATKAIGFAIEFVTPLGGTQVFLRLLEGTTIHLGLALDATGHIFLFRGTVANVLATTVETFSIGTVYHLGLKPTIHDSTGSYELWLNGTTLLFSGTNVDTRNGGTNGRIDTVAFLLTSTNVSPWIDDFYIHPCTGAAPFDGLLGDKWIEGQLPEDEGDVNDFAIGGSAPPATRPEAVDDASPNDDTDYLFDGTSGHRQYVSYPAMTGSPTGILAVKQCAEIRKDDASAVQCVISTRGADDINHDSAAISPASSYEHRAEMWTNNPSTGTRYTPSEVDNLQGGLGIV